MFETKNIIEIAKEWKDGREYVAVEDILAFIKSYETTLGDLPKELSELKKQFNTP